jgi:hypothetical protein
MRHGGQPVESVNAGAEAGAGSGRRRTDMAKHEKKPDRRKPTKDAQIDALVERAADAKRTADDLIRQMKELASEIERLKRRESERRRPKP